MDERSPKEKLLDACGVQNPGGPSRPPQDQERGKYYQAILGRAEDASASARLAQDKSEEIYQRLNDFIRKELPPHLVQAFREVSQEEIARALRPLHDSVSKEAARINSCAEELAGFTLAWRLLIVAVVVGIATVAVGAAFARFTFMDSYFEKAKHYELWGRDISARLKNSSPKERERFRKWLNGGNL